MKTPFWLGPETCIDLEEPSERMCALPLLSTGLSRQFRFGGWTQSPYSVATHSILVADLLPPELRLLGLLHDASEAYLGDVVHPLKAHLPNYRDLEWRMMSFILGHFKLDPDLLHSEVLKHADTVAAVTEATHLMGIDTREQWGYSTAPLSMRMFSSYANMDWQESAQLWTSEVVACIGSLMADRFMEHVQKETEKLQKETTPLS